jgi:hypothetical protein
MQSLPHPEIYVMQCLCIVGSKLLASCFLNEIAYFCSSNPYENLKSQQGYRKDTHWMLMRG